MAAERRRRQTLFVRPRVGVDHREVVHVQAQRVIPRRAARRQPGEFPARSRSRRRPAGEKIAARELYGQVEVGREPPGGFDEVALGLDAAGVEAQQRGQAGHDPETAAPFAEGAPRRKPRRFQRPQGGVGRGEVAGDERGQRSLALEAGDAAVGLTEEVAHVPRQRGVRRQVQIDEGQVHSPPPLGGAPSSSSLLSGRIPTPASRGSCQRRHSIRSFFRRTQDPLERPRTVRRHFVQGRPASRRIIRLTCGAPFLHCGGGIPGPPDADSPPGSLLAAVERTIMTRHIRFFSAGARAAICIALTAGALYLAVQPDGLRRGQKRSAEGGGRPARLRAGRRRDGDFRPRRRPVGLPAWQGRTERAGERSGGRLDKVRSNSAWRRTRSIA